jgi:hypothetical protein
MIKLKKIAMKKHIPLLLLIFSYTLSQSMEHKKSFKQLRLKYSHTPTSNESQKMVAIRQNINNFENQLKVEYWMEQTTVPVFSQLFSPRSILENPTVFLQYCYYKEIHKNHDHELDIQRLGLLRNPTLLKKCQEAQIDDYSALGATMIAKNISFDEKRIFIQELMDHNFKPTPQDRILARLFSYDEITKNRKELLCLLFTNAHHAWSTLPDELRRYIAEYSVQLFSLLSKAPPIHYNYQRYI